jgi:GT2 family glycosyltransferase
MMDNRLDRVDKNPTHVEINKDYSKLSWVPEWCMFCKLEDLKKINYFDENFFLYFEGVDLCKRLRDKGKILYLIKPIKIKHLFAGTARRLDKEKELSHWKLRFWHFYWSSFYFHRKHYGYFNSFKIHFGKLLRFFIKKNYLYFLNNKDYNYITTKAKFSGILNQMLNKKSYFRIKL